MRKLFTFGCSYTDYFYEEWYETYYKFRNNNFPKIWSEILSKELNFDLINYGELGSGNQRIFRQICKHIDEIKKDDLVIIEWSYVHRYDWFIFDTQELRTFGAGPMEDQPYLSSNTHNEIIVNRTSKFYYDDIIYLTNLLIKLFDVMGVKVFFWSVEYFNFYDQEVIFIKHRSKILMIDEIEKMKSSVFTVILSHGGEYIKDETKSLINNLHLGEKGHEIQAKLFLEHIKKYNI